MAVKTADELRAMLAAPDDWTAEALEAAQAELHQRNLEVTEPETPAASAPEEFAASEDSAASEDPTAPPVVPQGPTLPAGATCVQHPNVAATQRCRRCGAFMCATCDFSFPDDLHFCPACVAGTGEGLSPRRKKYLIAAYALAVWSTVGMTCLVSGALSGIAESEQEQVALGWVLLLSVLGPALTGLSLGITSKRRHEPNPASLWIAIVWNAILVTCFVVLMLIGVAQK